MNSISSSKCPLTNLVIEVRISRPERVPETIASKDQENSARQLEQEAIMKDDFSCLLFLYPSLPLPPPYSHPCPYGRIFQKLKYNDEPRSMLL
jgi:hypothetical protein